MTLIVSNSPLSKHTFRELLNNNNGFIFLKIGSKTCSPCRVITPFILEMFEKMPDNVHCICIDIDESIELFASLKKKEICNTIPSLLCYIKGNVSYIPDHMYSGTNIDEITKILNICKEP
jgi:NADH:ubiquinone oxidoreductase subunit F (NADH-binding)